ncbi:L-Ala-D/L-Glu epimerase [Phycisphaerae bacterium RAS2]|nr:L-Ala-D/L-Glu epimerase [Phycisphaerae bacterium RAS2]
MKQSFRHSAAQRAVAEPLIVEVELANRVVGFGETHPREYVTGESMDDAIAAIRDVFVPRLVDMRPANFGEAIEAADSLPFVDKSGRVLNAARAAVEVAILDAYARAFERSWNSIPGYLADQSLGPPGSRATARFSGVVSGEHADRVVRSIRKMRLIRLRHFKLKVGDEEDDARVESAARLLKRLLTSGGGTLRVDANSAWTLETARRKLAAWEMHPILCVEQPLPRGRMEDWATLASESNLPLMADESLVTLEDGEQLITHRAATWFNIRISKNGGLLPALRLALLARRHGVQCQLGCMVGETSLLSAAGRWFLQWTPGIEIAEGSFGRFLLRDDVTDRPIRFGCGGGWTPMTGPGSGVIVSAAKLAALASHPKDVIVF